MPKLKGDRLRITVDVDPITGFSASPLKRDLLRSTKAISVLL